MIVALLEPRRFASSSQSSSVTNGISGCRSFSTAAEHLDERVLRAAPQGGVGAGVRQHGFRELEVPVAELVPGEVVERLRDRDRGDRCAKFSWTEAIVALRRERIQRSAMPSSCGAVVDAAELAEDVRRRVPQLVAEAVIALGAREVEPRVAARSSPTTRT